MSDDRKIQRFFLQNVARGLLSNVEQKDGKKRDERVCFCLRHRVFGAETVDIRHNAKRGRAYYGNLQTCGSVWSCPVCSAKITERRRRELSEGIEAARAMGYTPVLVTQTLRHNVGDKLGDLLTELQDASSRFRGGRPYKRIRERFGVVGIISALEVTQGNDNGWHPHRHELWILDHEPGEGELDELRDVLRERWLHVLRRYDASYERGLTVERDVVDDYIAKFGREPVDLERCWTLAHEMAKSPVKRAREGRRGPFQLLADYANGDKQAGALFREYAGVFKGRRQMYWSRGLRALLGVGVEVKDEEVAEEIDEVDPVLAQLTKGQWRVVRRNKARGELLRVADSGDVGAVWDFLDGLEGMAELSPHYEVGTRVASSVAAVVVREGELVNFMVGDRLCYGRVVDRVAGRVEIQGWMRDKVFKRWLSATDVTVKTARVT